MATNSTPANDKPPPAPTVRRSPWKHIAVVVVVLLAIYLVVAYFFMPEWWLWQARRHPDLDDIPNVTRTANDIPGDPINVALVGSEDELKAIMKAAKWFPADPLTLRDDVKIALASVLKHEYDDAPVSNLFLFGRKQDLAFEQPVGDSPRQRHHVRFWKAKKEENGRPVWVGSAIFDDRVGINRKTGQITHHTAANIDAERSKLFADLDKTGDLAETYFIDDFHTKRDGRNGGGDPWYTDGRLEVGIIKNY
jgi:hypothetical protein